MRPQNTLFLPVEGEFLHSVHIGVDNIYIPSSNKCVFCRRSLWNFFLHSFTTNSTTNIVIIASSNFCRFWYSCFSNTLSNISMWSVFILILINQLSSKCDELCPSWKTEKIVNALISNSGECEGLSLCIRKRKIQSYLLCYQLTSIINYFKQITFTLLCLV